METMGTFGTVATKEIDRARVMSRMRALGGEKVERQNWMENEGRRHSPPTLTISLLPSTYTPTYTSRSRSRPSSSSPEPSPRTSTKSGKNKDRKSTSSSKPSSSTPFSYDMLFSLTTPLNQIEACVRSRVAKDAGVDERGVRVWFKGWEEKWGEDSMVMSRGDGYEVLYPSTSRLPLSVLLSTSSSSPSRSLSSSSSLIICEYIVPTLHPLGHFRFPRKSYTLPSRMGCNAGCFVNVLDCNVWREAFVYDVKRDSKGAIRAYFIRFLGWV